MLKLRLATFFAILVSAPTGAFAQAAAGQSDGLAEAVTGACLQALGDRPHGLERVEAGGRRALCVRGMVGLDDRNVRAADFVQAARDNAGKLDGIFFTSQGGQGEPWLEFAERIGEVDFVIVGGLCTSGCANYGFVLGRRKIVLPNSFVGWHGGPVNNRAAAKRFMRRATLGQLVINGEVFGNRPGNPFGRLVYDRNTSARFLEIGRLTEALYRRLGISARIISDTTGARPPSAIVEEVHRRHRPEEILAWLVLFPPDVLSRCYGFTGLEEMWHPGGPEEVMQLGLQLAPPGGFVAMPRDMGENGCPAEPE